MPEQLQLPPQNQTLGPSGSGDPFGEATSLRGMVTVSHGVFGESLPVGGMTIGEIRRRLADRLSLDPQSQAQIDGRDADESFVVRPGQQLHFVRNAGEKGS